MEKPPYVFRIITYFSVGSVEKKNPRIDYITKLTLEIGSELPKGKFSLELTKPFQPLCRGGEKLINLQYLDHNDIESISTFRGSNGEKKARIEIQMKEHGSTIYVKCGRIEGIPGWNERQ